MDLFVKHKTNIDAAIIALRERAYFTLYPETPKSYDENGDNNAKKYFSSILNNNFVELIQTSSEDFFGEEISPFMQVGLGIQYPITKINTLISNAQLSHKSWSHITIEQRTGLLVEILDRLKLRFFDIAYATMHTTGQSYLMSFQASGPHSNDRALEAVIQGYLELTRYTSKTDWIKPMGKFDLKMHKTFKPMSKGIGLVIGCSTFPIWNTLPGLFANLITGNSVIVKPHPKAVLPIAIVIGEIQKVFKEYNIDVNTAQLAIDSTDKPLTKELAEHPSITLVDYTGNSIFGNYIESLPKTTFTEKAGVNTVIIESVDDLNAVMQNLAFAVSLYSGQMCTAPQNIYISKDGIKSKNGVIFFDDSLKLFCNCINGLIDNPKAGPSVLGAIQSDITLKRVKDSLNIGGKVILESKAIKNEEFPDARIASPTVIQFSSEQKDLFNHEYFGPIVCVIKTDSVAESIDLAKNLVKEKGAITCAAYSIDESVKLKIEEEMNEVFAPVSFNFTGAAFINSHAAFSDFHVTGGNVAGNASFVNSEFISKRFVWVGNRYA